MFTLSSDGEKLIKGFEGLKLNAYLCPAGKPTIGWGCTHNVHLGMCISLEQAEAMFKAEMATFEAGVNAAIGDSPTYQHEFDAMVSFAYNLGIGALLGSSLLKYHKVGDHDLAADEFIQWDHEVVPEIRTAA